VVVEEEEVGGAGASMVADAAGGESVRALGRAGRGWRM